MEKVEEDECTAIHDLDTKKKKAHTIIGESLGIIITDHTTFLPIIFLTFIPIFLVLLFSISTAPLRAEISCKQALLASLPGGVASLNVRAELIGNVYDLLKRKATTWLPIYAFSLLSTTTAIKFAACSHRCQRPRFHTAFICVKEAWWRVAIASLYVTVLKETYDQVARGACIVVASRVQEASMIAAAATSVVIWGGLAVLRVYMMAVLSMGMVVSVLEEKWGLEALMVGWQIVEGRRLSGWILGGFQAVLSGGIGWWWSRETGGGINCNSSDGGGGGSSSGGGGGLLLVGLMSVVVVLSDVINTVFYFECKMWQCTLGESTEKRESE